MFGIFFSNADVEPHIDSLKGNNFFLKQSILELIQYRLIERKNTIDSVTNKLIERRKIEII